MSPRKILPTVVAWLFRSEAGFYLLWIAWIVVCVGVLDRLLPWVFTTSMVNVVGFAVASAVAYGAARVCVSLYARWDAGRESRP